MQAGATSWKAFFFGASDAAGAITVDKPPGALWPMALTARVFGVNAWSVLVPQALMGVATVGTLYAAVHRRFPAWAGLLAGAALALTPVAALMFRFNNPDAARKIAEWVSASYTATEIGGTALYDLTRS
ncbi:ArnT family glycosyltransferase [Actinomadura sp. LOL_016]|uniref:ArnT family glycosyltransferase n=1 Tax=unclassified Actinomadura TaxID=2626254 RepID=UPI003A810E6D